ncbi:Terpenoid cyclases/protein prenyltransferase alpha-alpha toroid [Penicillium expansum]|uniref:protein geranylgeranyltransferase type II n=1 Tax=Penicillium expansum TaxID=27334 RepID=A0A0A2JMM4_PENEN|nr:Terpenoid cyclases/protein prenyltransferase alpha-alpha toroid [Penicillium expansum]KGO56647.1 Terpenoid cyclases/protein prenyltransferase alpha-alpha toroid [Penicillium expansum]
MALVSGPGRAGGSPADSELHTSKHVTYIKNLDTRKDELEYWLTEHLRLNGVYWGLTALHILGHPDTLPRDQTIDFVLSCQNDNGGFGAAPGHDAHMLYTVSAVQILITIDAVDELEKRGRGGKEKVGSFIANLQNADGSFMGDQWGETDTRFLYGAFNALSLLRLMDLVDVPKAVSHIQSCENLDGAYGIRPGAESHAGQVFTCIGALAIAGRLDLVNKDRLGAWLSERQIESGGFNGRPEKLADACYSWWVGSSLAMIDRLHWIDGEKLAAFVLQCQDPDAGGFADRPGNMVDVYHTNFSLAGLSLLKFNGLEEIDAVYCMPKSITTKCLAGVLLNGLWDTMREENIAHFDLFRFIPLYNGQRAVKTSWACIMDDTILVCSICPGQPRFSDVSHLLTHAASKAHLASHFKLKLRTDDPNSIELLKQYDDWFDANGFAKQLAARMASKEIRKKRKSDEVSASQTIKRTRNRASDVEPEGSSTCKITTTPVSDCLDPRLADSHNDKQHHADTTLTPTTPKRLPNSNAESRTGPILRSMRSLNGTKSSVLHPVDASGPSDEARSLALPVTPIQRRHKPDPLERTWASGRDTPDPFIDSGNQTQASSGDPETDKTRAEEIARLKGVLWPGMNIFDSATVQMRRRRNQKKDGAVLRMMELTSSLVEPTEQVFSPHGTLLKERVITGNVEEYSPLKGETPIPRRGLTRTRTVRLTKADPNVPRALDRKRQKIDKDRKNIEEETAKEEQKSPRRARRAADRTHSYVGDDEEFGFTVNTFGKRPRGGFDVFVDEEKEEEESKTSYQELGYRTQFDTLTPTRLVLNGKTSTGIHASRIGHTSLDKENIEPILNPQGRIGPHGWHSPFAKRTDPDDFGFGLPYLSDLGDPYDSFDKAGYRFNPLQAPSKHPFFDSQYEEEQTAAQNGWLSMNQTVPSEETIPEDDHFPTYYLTTDAN